MICYECKSGLGKPVDEGCHTARKMACDYCDEVKVCLPDRHTNFFVDESDIGKDVICHFYNLTSRCKLLAIYNNKCWVLFEKDDTTHISKLDQTFKIKG